VLRQQQALIAAEQMRVNRQATKAAAEEKKDLTEAEQKAKEEAEFKVRQDAASAKLVAFFRGIVVRKKGLEYTRVFAISEPLGMGIENLQVEELMEDGQATKLNVKVGTYVVAVNGTSPPPHHTCTQSHFRLPLTLSSTSRHSCQE
jgi:hypothetical protein